VDYLLFELTVRIHRLIIGVHWNGLLVLLHTLRQLLLNQHLLRILASTIRKVEGSGATLVLTAGYFDCTSFDVLAWRQVLILIVTRSWFSVVLHRDYDFRNVIVATCVVFEGGLVDKARRSLRFLPRKVLQQIIPIIYVITT
jgi:hypothetical protein